MKSNKDFDIKIIGAGVAGCCLARLAANAGYSVLLVERTNQIGGQTAESIVNGYLVQQYGPHILYGNDERVFDFLSNYTELKKTKMTVAAEVNGEYVRLPLNFNTLDDMFKDESKRIKNFLLSHFNYGEKIRYSEINNFISETGSMPETKMLEYAVKVLYDEFSKKLWRDEYKKLFTLDRVPIIIGYTNYYYPAKYHYLPKNGYNEMFKNMIDHPNITILFNTIDRDISELKPKLLTINTGKIDKFYGYTEGKLPYRSIDFKYRYTSTRLPFNSVHYPLSESHTRISDMSTIYDKEGKTIHVIEIPDSHIDGMNLPLYIIDTEENRVIYNKYINIAQKSKKVLHIGRCAEYKYYTMHDLILRCLNIDFDKLI